jgi:demethylmenaquinone methyltransferase/2-methoxy-6-polyprenyl-1,4-benzoquinol methylase
MTSFLRPLAYRHRWIYDSVTAVSSLSVGGVARLRGLGLESLRNRLEPDAEILDLCCGSGEAAAPWISAGYAVTGLDVSPRALDLAAQRHPSCNGLRDLLRRLP